MLKAKSSRRLGPLRPLPIQVELFGGLDAEMSSPFRLSCAFPICSCIEGLDTLYIIVPRLLGVFHVTNYDQKLSVIEG